MLVDTEEFTSLEVKRGDGYRLTAALFYTPVKELLIEEKVCANLATMLEAICPGACPHARSMDDELAKADAEALAVEHARLFIGPFGVVVPPYGSIYLDESKTLMGESTMEVQRYYQQAGLTIDDDGRDAPDHITIELEFMYYLAACEVKHLQEGEAEKAAECLQTQNDFCDTFMRPWVQPFCEKIIESTNSPFYSALADCTSQLIMNTPVPQQIP